MIFNIKLAAIQQCFGFDTLKCNITSMIDEIKHLKEASLERLSTFIQERCIQVVKTYSDDDIPQAMCVSNTTGNFFNDYENHIHNIVHTLHQQPLPMEVGVSPCKRRLKSKSL